MSEVESEERGKVVKLFPVFRYLSAYKRQIVIASIALIVTASVTLSIGYGLRELIDSGLGQQSSEVLVDSIGLFGALVVLLTTGTFVRYYYVSWVGERVSADIRRAVFDHLIHLHPGFFETNLPTEIQSRITTDTTLLQTVIGSSVSIALRNILMFFGGLTLLFITNPKLSLLVISAVPLVVTPIILFGRRVRRLSRTSQDTLAVVGSHVGESLRHIKVVQAFNHQEQDQREFAEKVEGAFDVAVHRIRQRAWLVAVVMLLIMGAISAMLWVGGQDVVSGETTAGELTQFIFYAILVAGSVGAISEVLGDLQRAAGAMERLVELLGSPSILVESDHPHAFPVPLKGALEICDVSFAYPSRPELDVITALSVTVNAGEMVALVGPSGAGKSTLFDLLLRFYDPDSGAIKLDGVDISQATLNSLRSHIAIVPQDSILFSGTLEDNLLYGTSGVTEDEVIEALDAAHAKGFVDQLTDGLQTIVGEGGAGLSGGQRQRLAIARALITKPKLLLMDEVTSALDAESEAEIKATIEGLKGQCTVLVIAHRLSTVISANRILVFDKGSMVAAGTHEELLLQSDLYARFARIQLSQSKSSNWSSESI